MTRQKKGCGIPISFRDLCQPGKKKFGKGCEKKIEWKSSADLLLGSCSHVQTLLKKEGGLLTATLRV
jgi:hypothetical protein